MILHGVVTGSKAGQQSAAQRPAATSQKRQVEELALKTLKAMRGGMHSEKWEVMDRIIRMLPMHKTRNGVRLMQFGAMHARGRRQAAADAVFPHFVRLLYEFMHVHGPIPVRHLDWGQMLVVCIRGKSSSYHVDPHNGLTFTACNDEGVATAKLEYADGGHRPLGRYLTEILPHSMHRVVAAAERTAISVYLSPLVPYRSYETRASGPMQMVVRLKDGKGETQHAWPHSVSARFLLSQSLKQLGAEVAYTQITLTALNGKRVGMDEVVPAGSTIFAQLEVATPSFHLSAGGKWESPLLSDGEVVKKIRQVRPQLEPQQVKALLGGSPKLLNAVQTNVQGQKLQDQILHEEQRQGLVPKLAEGWSRESERSKTSQGQEAWQQVTRKGSRKTKPQEEVPTVRRTMQLQQAQVVCEGRPLPVREVLLHGYGGVCIVRTKEELIKLAKLHKHDGRTPQVAVAATKYVLSEDERK
eukprot:4191632-Amphidinium_carterae.1